LAKKAKIHKRVRSAAVSVFVLVFVIISSGVISAHGYVDSPASRAQLCRLGVNTNCGPVQYEPHSIEAKGNFPAGGPADGQITGGGIFPELFEQTATRWSKVNMNGGPNTFHWTLTAAHATTEWKYYITKIGWNPNKPIARSDLELFCSFNDGGARPASSVTHTCNVPTDRSGYYVILGVWEIADTGNAFYQAIDVNLSNGDTGGGSDTQAPTAPSNLRSTDATSSSITLAWNAATDNVGVTGYTIYRGTTPVGSVAGTLTSFTVTGLSAGTQYTFTVKAKDAAGNESGASSAVTASTAAGPEQDEQAPSAPSDLTATATTSSTISLSWKASSDNAGVTGYNIYNGTEKIGSVAGTLLSYTASGLTANSTYTFTVTAFDAAGNESDASNAATATTSAPSTEAPDWGPNTSYNVNDLVTYNGIVYKCRQAHTSLPGWEPPTTPALWIVV
jgi:chitin-binding protein